MRTPRGTCAALALAIASLPLAAHAAPPYDPAIDVQLFDYAVGPKQFFTVADADTADKKQLAVDAMLTFLANPFRVYNVDPTNMSINGTRTDVVKSMFAGSVSAAYGLTDKLQVGVSLPLVLSMTGDGLDPVSGMGASSRLSITGLGDLRGELKARLWRRGQARLGALGSVTLPTSFGAGGSSFIGDDLPTVRGGVAFQVDQDKLALGANAGVILRKPRTIYDNTIGEQVTWSLGAAYHVTERFSVIGEGFGRFGLGSSDLALGPIEVEGGVRVLATDSIAVVAGGGGGVHKGIGSPTARFFLSLGYAPDVRDTDGDGVPNSRDKCPLIPEDRDGFQDDDGCPDDDNDGDMIPDAQDKCPNQAEDHDGFQDDDGCPDPDNDGDGILDADDKCPDDKEDGKEPNPKDGCPADKRDSDGDGLPDIIDQCPLEAEDKDGFEDGDGCPDPDNDADGIPDVTDKCPVCPEDKDGFQDDDGCPDLDNDHDGIPDSRDKCPNEPETVNGVDDDDGCPDSGGRTVVRLDGDRLEIDLVPSYDAAGLTRAGEIVVDQMALIMAGHDEVTKWIVAIAAPSAAEAKHQAEALKARLVAKGLPAERFAVIEAAGAARIGGVVQERVDPDADVVPACPAGLEAKPRPDRVERKPMPASTTDAATPAVPATTARVVPPAATPAKPASPATSPAAAVAPAAGTTSPDDPRLAKLKGRIDGIDFKPGTADLTPASHAVLDAAAQSLVELADVRLEIESHTDDAAPPGGSPFANNVAMSQARAETIRGYLIAHGVAEARLVPRGYGDSIPVESTKGKKHDALRAARAKNRRVEFKPVK